MWHVKPTVDWIYRGTCHEKCTFSENFQINLFQHLHKQMSGTVSNESDATWHKKIRGLTPAGVERMGKVVVASSVPTQHGA
jgi:hypothetical protein